MLYCPLANQLHKVGAGWMIVYVFILRPCLPSITPQKIT